MSTLWTDLSIKTETTFSRPFWNVEKNTLFKLTRNGLQQYSINSHSWIAKMTFDKELDLQNDCYSFFVIAHKDLIYIYNNDEMTVYTFI